MILTRLVDINKVCEVKLTDGEIYNVNILASGSSAHLFYCYLQQSISVHVIHLSSYVAFAGNRIEMKRKEENSTENQQRRKREQCTTTKKRNF